MRILPRRRCASCKRRIWPWQTAVGWGVMGEPDHLGHNEHADCMHKRHEQKED